MNEQTTKQPHYNRFNWEEVIETQCLDIEEERWFEKYVISQDHSRQADLETLQRLYKEWKPQRFSR